MIFKPKRVGGAAILGICLLLFASCSDKSSGPNNGPFDIYGRIVWRPPLAGLTHAEFYIFSNGQPVTDAEVTAKGFPAMHDTVDLSLYSAEFPTRIGDTLFYSISSAVGSASGNVIIPDTVNIIRPRQLDTLYTGSSFSAVWHRGDRIDGYFAHLAGQHGAVARVTESQIDTTAEYLGDNILDIGADTFWVETLSGQFSEALAPNGRVLPKGIVGAAGNCREVYVNFSTALGK